MVLCVCTLLIAASVVCCRAVQVDLPVTRPARAGDHAPPVLVGVSRIDITPEHPVRLAGYAARKSESEGVAQRIWAKALAIGCEGTAPAVLVTVDSCAVSPQVVEAVADSLEQKARVPRERLVVCSSHSHSTPCQSGTLCTLFGEPIPPDQQERIDRYTRQVREKIEQVALEALADRRTARLAWGQGRAAFAANRRLLKNGRYAGFGVNRDGPVDHSLPVLRVTDLEGRLRAVVVNYACHCTTFGQELNQVGGDWAGFAQESVEADHPGAVCMVTIGCGGDANPFPRTGDSPELQRSLEFAKRHGREVADEVNRLLKGELRPVTSVPVCRLERIRLPFDPVPSRQEWERRAEGAGARAYHARVQLARLDRGESLPIDLPFPVQTWVFGQELAMVFLAGEVVVDYSLALKKEYGADRLWVTAYANDVPCYIPSRRILAEGGYEAEENMIYYDRPAPLAPEVEERVLGAVRRLMPAHSAR